MPITLSQDCQNVNWDKLRALLERSGMGVHTPQLHRLAFENSYRRVFLYDGDSLVGCGRLLSDGAYQGAVYDVAVDSRYRGHGLGKKIMDELLEGTENMAILLYAAPGKEPFYEKLGFHRARTGMVRFKDPLLMKDKGFI